MGVFKGVIRITEAKSEAPAVPLERVAPYVCRVYVWKGDGLQPCDPNGKADPYLKVTVGKFHVSRRKQHLKATLKVGCGRWRWLGGGGEEVRCESGQAGEVYTRHVAPSLSHSHTRSHHSLIKITRSKTDLSPASLISSSSSRYR